mmetsp:Transcript_27856/g.45245  ORF Transcript_27856/g.45245 Transcript_27856/m.45245 type:complete len:105 (-) Transcript_27856:410-724(-)
MLVRQAWASSSKVCNRSSIQVAVSSSDCIVVNKDWSSCRARGGNRFAIQSCLVEDGLPPSPIGSEVELLLLLLTRRDHLGAYPSVLYVEQKFGHLLKREHLDET